MKDLDSANGTRLRGEAVEQSLLHPGDILQIGHSLLAYDEKPLERRGVIRVTAS